MQDCCQANDLASTLLLRELKAQCVLAQESIGRLQGSAGLGLGGGSLPGLALSLLHQTFNRLQRLEGLGSLSSGEGGVLVCAGKIVVSIQSRFVFGFICISIAGLAAALLKFMESSDKYGPHGDWV